MDGARELARWSSQLGCLASFQMASTSAVVISGPVTSLRSCCTLLASTTARNRPLVVPLTLPVHRVWAFAM